MQLFHERVDDRPGGLDARDEEECFTAEGRKVGVYLSTDAVKGERAFAADVDPDEIEAYEVTKDGSDVRSFVVPGAVAATLGFEPIS